MGCYCYIIDPTGNLDNYLKQIRDFEKLLGSPPLESSDHMITNLYSNIFMFGMFSDILTTFKATSYTSEEEIVRLAIKFKKHKYLKFVHSSKYYYLTETELKKNSTFSLFNFSNYSDESLFKRIIKMSNTLYIFCKLNDISFDESMRKTLEYDAFIQLCGPKEKSIETTVDALTDLYIDMKTKEYDTTALNILISYFNEKLKKLKGLKINKSAEVLCEIMDRFYKNFLDYYGRASQFNCLKTKQHLKLQKYGFVKEVDVILEDDVKFDKKDEDEDKDEVKHEVKDKDKAKDEAKDNVKDEENFLMFIACFYYEIIKNTKIQSNPDYIPVYNILKQIYPKFLYLSDIDIFSIDELMIRILNKPSLATPTGDSDKPILQSTSSVSVPYKTILFFKEKDKTEIYINSTEGNKIFDYIVVQDKDGRLTGVTEKNGNKTRNLDNFDRPPPLPRLDQSLTLPNPRPSLLTRSLSSSAANADSDLLTRGSAASNLLTKRGSTASSSASAASGFVFCKNLKAYITSGISSFGLLGNITRMKKDGTYDGVKVFELFLKGNNVEKMDNLFKEINEYLKKNKKATISFIIVFYSTNSIIESLLFTNEFNTLISRRGGLNFFGGFEEIKKLLDINAPGGSYSEDPEGKRAVNYILENFKCDDESKFLYQKKIKKSKSIQKKIKKSKSIQKKIKKSKSIQKKIKKSKSIQKKIKKSKSIHKKNKKSKSIQKKIKKSKSIKKK